MSFVLPNPSMADNARRDYYHPAPSSSAAPVASTSAAPMSSGAMPSDGRRAPPGRPATRRKGKGKGRTMMIKIFYSLNSPRFGTPSSSSTTPNPILPASTPTPDFLAVLDPSLAPSPNPPTQDPAQAGSTNYSCMARLSAPVWVQVLGARRSADGEEASQFGRVTLKTCLSAICISRPELVIDSTKDFSVSAVDPYESSHQRQAPGGPSAGTTAASRPGEGLVEGKGMLSWTLAEKKEGTTMVCGKIVSPAGGDARRGKRRRADDGSVFAGFDDGEDEESDGDEPEETLEVWLQLTERDAFTQGQFLDCLRSYHNPVQHLQNEISDFNSSPPKRRESAVFAPSSTAPAPRPSTSSSGDPVKRKRPREQPSLPVPPPPATSAAPAPFATGPPESSPATFSAPLPSLDPALGLNAPDLQDPRSAAMLNQLLASLATGGDGAASALPQSLPLDSPQLLPALQTLAKYYGLELPAQSAAPAGVSLPFATGGATFATGPQATPAASTSAPPAQPQPASTAPSASGSTARRRATKDREHFAAIDPNTLAAPPVGKQNPRDPGGCCNCKRKKSTTWREGTDADGKLMSVCNACGIFFNKNGYHRSKTGPNAPPAGTSPPQSSAAVASSSVQKGARPLQGRLTATCEADLKRKAKKQKAPASAHAGIIPPLSPSKHVGPRSPALKFDIGAHRSAGRSAAIAMSSPGRSPRLRYRSVAHPYPATSPLRGSTSSARAAAGAGYESDGEERGPNPLFGSLFGLNGSPSPVRIEQRVPSGGKVMPSYLLTASPGTALDRILNDTNIGSIGGIGPASGAGEAMQLEQQGDANPTDSLGDEFAFFLQPGSPTRNKENARPRAAASTDAPTTDFESFESVLSSLRRDFNARLSSNALTAPSSPAPSSPCVLPRTSTATPGSKGKAPQSGGRAPPSILDSFMDSLVPGLVLNPEAAGSSKQAQTGFTPASDSDAWSPPDPAQQDQDQTLTLDSCTGGASAAPERSSRSSQMAGNEAAHLTSSKNVNRRAPFIPAHLLAPSDATDFDLGSLPPSSPPQLPSEAFPTPSDFDGITPSADGGDNEEQRAQHGTETLSIEAVAQQVAREPDADARKGMIALLQSLGSNAGGSGEQVAMPGPAGDQIQLDRGTVNKLLALISANSHPGGADDVSPTPAGEPFATAATAGKATTSSAPVAQEQPHAPDLSGFDFKAFDAGSASMAATAAQVFGGGGQMSELYQDLFSGAPAF
ncbi:hypothetical protein JCM10449v2_000717 [Rhodotorula kratochvilovae]